MLLPTWGWIDDNSDGEDDEAKRSRLNPARPPDWRWRVTPLLDERPDVVPTPPPQDPNAVRPTPIRVFPLDECDEWWGDQWAAMAGPFRWQVHGPMQTHGDRPTGWRMP